MSDKELIFKYLNKYYFVIIATKYKHTEFMLGAIGKKEMYSRNDIYDEIKLVFNCIDDLAGHFENWFNESLSSLTKNFDSFLAECRLILGPRNWVVKHNIYGEINPELLTTYHGTEKSAHSALRYLFNKWYDEKVIEASERAMRNF